MEMGDPPLTLPIRLPSTAPSTPQDRFQPGFWHASTEKEEKVMDGLFISHKEVPDVMNTKPSPGFCHSLQHLVGDRATLTAMGVMALSAFI